MSRGRGTMYFLISFFVVARCHQSCSRGDHFSIIMQSSSLADGVEKRKREKFVVALNRVIEQMMIDHSENRYTARGKRIETMHIGHAISFSSNEFYSIFLLRPSVFVHAKSSVSVPFHFGISSVRRRRRSTHLELI